MVRYSHQITIYYRIGYTYMDKERALVSFNSDPETLEFLKESAKKNGFENMSDLLRSMVIDLKNMSSKQIPDWLYGGEVSKAELHRFAISLDKSDLDKDWKRRIVLYWIVSVVWMVFGIGWNV